MTKERRSLRDMAAGSAQNENGRIECPRCGCTDFRTYGTIPASVSTFRYKSCRHCGHRVLTTTKSVERIVRDVRHDEDDDEGGPIYRIV